MVLVIIISHEWYYILELGKDANGQRFQKKKSGFKTKEVANQALISAQNEVLKDTYIEVSKLQLKDYWPDWFKVKRNTLRIQIQMVYEGINKNHLSSSGERTTYCSLPSTS